MISEYKENIKCDQEFLADAINMVEEYYLYPKSYEDLAHIISIEFNCKCRTEDITKYFKNSNAVKTKNIFNPNVTIDNVDTHFDCIICYDTKKVYNGGKYVNCPKCKK